MSARIRIATRGSALARTQSGHVADALAAALGCTVELVTITTTGDRILDQPLARIGGKGLFIKEVEEALLDGRADLAVHSAKDLPARLADGLALAAFPERADPRDAWVCAESGVASPLDLPEGARVGTGSVRRTSLLRALRPDLEIVPMRGNVDTRLRKLEAEGLDGIFLACAGLDRLGLGARIRARLEPEWMLPAVGQGVLALETRADDPLAEQILAIDHAPTRRAIGAERAFLARVEGDCSVPLAAHAEERAGRLRLRALVSSLDGAQVVRSEAETDATSEAAESAGTRVGEELLAAGGRALIAAAEEASA